MRLLRRFNEYVTTGDGILSFLAGYAASLVVAAVMVVGPAFLLSLAHPALAIGWVAFFVVLFASVFKP